MSNRQKAESIGRAKNRNLALHMLINMRSSLSDSTYKTYLKQLKGIL